MKTKHEDYLERIRAVYAPYPEIATSELARADQLMRDLNKSRDPSFLSYADDPITKKILSMCQTMYRSMSQALVNDDGNMTPIERAQFQISRKWALFFIRQTGGDPVAVQEKVEKEIEDFARAANVL